MKKQTAVEWLFAHLIPHLDWSKVEDRELFRKLKAEALAMEKEQIVESHLVGQEVTALYATTGKSSQTSIQYYNETFK